MSLTDYQLQSQKILDTISTISLFASHNISHKFVTDTILDEIYIKLEELKLSLFNITVQNTRPDYDAKVNLMGGTNRPRPL